VFFELKQKKGNFSVPSNKNKTWADVDRIRINLRFTADVPVDTKFWFDDFKLAGGFDIDGEYKYRYILVEKSGTEIISKSNPFSGATSPITIQTNRIPVSIATLPSAGIKHVYRSFAGDFSDFFFDGEVLSGATTHSSEKADADLGEILSTDNNVPPITIDMAGPHFDRIFGIDATLADKIVFSKAKEPDSFPVNNHLLIGTPGDPAKRVVLFEGVLYVFTVGGIYYIQGSDENSFVAIRTRAELGTTSPHSVAVADRGIYYLAKDGVRFFDGIHSEMISSEIDPVFYGQQTLGIDDFDMTLTSQFRGAYFDEKYFLSYVQGGSSENDRILIWDERFKRWWRWDFDSARFLFVEKINNFLTLAADDGFVYFASNGLGSINGTDANSTATILTAFRDIYGHPGIKLAKDIYPDLDVPDAAGVTITPIVDGTSKAALTFAQSTDRTVRRIRLPGHKGRVFEWRLSSPSYFRSWGMLVDVKDFNRGGYRKAVHG
jgi:hypothetical protein